MRRCFQALLSFIFVYVPLFCATSIAEPVEQKASEHSLSDIHDLRIDNEFRDLLKKLQITTKEIETTLRKNSDNDANRYLATRSLDESKHYFDVFIATFTIILAVVSIVTALVGVLAYRTLSYALKRNLTKQFREEEENERAKILATTFRAFSFTWFSIYWPKLMDLVRDKTKFFDDNDKPNETFIELADNIGKASTMTDNALKHLDDPKIVKLIQDDPVLWSVEVGLRNHRIFHDAAMLILEKKQNSELDQSRINNLIKRAQALVDETIDNTRYQGQSTKAEWWEQQSTAALAMIMIGDDENKQTGREILKNLINGKKPTNDHRDVPQNWINESKNEFERMNIQLCP